SSTLRPNYRAVRAPGRPTRGAPQWVMHPSRGVPSTRGLEPRRSTGGGLFARCPDDGRRAVGTFEGTVSEVALFPVPRLDVNDDILAVTSNAFQSPTVGLDELGEEDTWDGLPLKQSLLAFRVVGVCLRAERVVAEIVLAATRDG